MALRTLILDDESLAISSIRVDLERHCPEIIIVNAFQNPMDAVEYLKHNQIDLLFLDIEMPEMTGIAFLENLGKFNFEVVFTTAYAEYALTAYKLNVIDYLLKPVGLDELKRAISKVVEKKLHIQAANPPQKIALSDSTGLEFVPLKQVMYCLADKNYTTFHLFGGKTKMVSKNIGEFEKTLSLANFVRIHQSSIVNVDFVSKLIKGETGSAIMEDGRELSISRSRRKEFWEALQNLL